MRISKLSIGFLVVPLLASLLACNLSGAPEPTPAESTLDTRTLTAVVAQMTAIAVSSLTPVALPATPIPATSGGSVQPLPSCTVRTDWPLFTVPAGDTLSGIAQRVGTTIDALMTANCLANANTLVAGQQLRVPQQPAGPTAITTPIVATAIPNGCNQWFFTFSATVSDTGCADAATSYVAIGENFQGGRVYIYPVLPYFSQSPTVLVIYNDGGWAYFADTWNNSMPANDPSLVAPVNFYQPQNGIGKIWREHTDVRAKLGWAYEPEKPFSGRIQALKNQNPATIPYLYVEHGFNRAVLRLTVVNGIATTWIVAGTA